VPVPVSIQPVDRAIGGRGRFDLMRQIRILHVIGQLRRGGCELQLLGLCQRLDRARFDSAICWYVRQADELEEDFRRAGVRMHFFSKPSMSVWRFFERLRGVVKEVEPDVIHTWMYSANFWGRLAAVTCGVSGIIASERGEVRMTGLIDRASEWFFRSRTLRLANSRFIASSLERHFGLPAEQTRIVHNAVGFELPDREAARSSLRRELGLAADTAVVLTVGRLGFPKNYPMLVRVVGRLERSGSNAVVAVVGTGPDEDVLKRQVRGAGLDHRMRFLGFRDDVPSLLAGADVFCFTSDSEGFPNAVLEAMLAGLPVVCTDFPSAREMISDPRAGILVSCDDDAGMAEAIGDLLARPECRREIGMAARAHVQEHFSWDRLVETMSEIYEELAGRKRLEDRVPVEEDSGHRLPR